MEKPIISIIVEWENVVLSEMQRCINMLRVLYKQAIDLEMPIEIIIINNPEQVKSTEVKCIVNENIDLDINSFVKLRFEEAMGCHYYELKNHGASIAHGEIVVFLDSDVVPEDRWLYELTIPIFEDFTVNVVAGNTYIDPADTINKAFALGWFFPTKQTDPMKNNHCEEFYANNVAFRKALFDINPFPKMPDGMTRGSCELLAERLIEQNIPILFNGAAQTSHPAPSGIQHFLIRALANGRDRFLRKKMEPASTIKSYLYLHSYGFRRFKQTIHRSLQKYEYFELSFMDKLSAYFIMYIYYTLVIIGGSLTLLFPAITSKSWRV